MNDLAINEDGDLLIANYDLQIVTSLDQTIQELIIRLKFFLGEWFLDTEAGIPYYQDFFVKAPNQIRIESVLKNEILDTPGILELTSFVSDFDEINRKYSVRFGALADEGEFELEVTLP